MIAFSVFLTVCFLIFMVNRSGYQPDINSRNGTNKTLHTFGYPWNQLWISFIEEYCSYFVRYLVNTACELYMQLTIANVAKFTIKYIPSGYYTYKSLKYFYRTSQERIRLKKMELEELELQMEIVNEKLSVRDTELSELTSQLHRDAERLRKVRAQIRQLLATDKELRQALGIGAPWPRDTEPADFKTTDDDDEEESDHIMSLLEEMKGEPSATPEKLTETKCAESGEMNQSKESFYSSPDDSGVQQECRVKIIKVTNVYKVAYLRQYIKQKKMRRASQHALLKKKIESIQKLLESWQKSLNMVITSKLVFGASTEVSETMGDYSKANVRESQSNTDLLKNNGDYYDEYRLDWPQNIYRNYNHLSYNFEGDIPEESVDKEFNEDQEYSDSSYPRDLPGVCECKIPRMSNQLFVLPEETTSQMAFEQAIDEDAFAIECRDTIAV